MVVTPALTQLADSDEDHAGTPEQQFENEQEDDQAAHEHCRER